MKMKIHNILNYIIGMIVMLASVSCTDLKDDSFGSVVSSQYNDARSTLSSAIRR